MLKFSLWLKLAALGLALMVSGCGGGAGSSAAPPNGFTVTPGNGQVIVTWQATGGVEYWLMYAATASAIDLKNPPAGHVWATSVTSPYVISGLTNGVTYSFAMNARTSGGPGGAQTASLSATPRYAGSTWTAGTGAAGNLRGLMYGTSAADSLAYFVTVGDTGAIYKAADGVSQSVAGYSWSQVTGGPSVDFKAATYAFSKFVAVGANGVGNNIYYSSDLATWSPATTVIGTSLNAVASNGTTMVAVGNSGTVYYSADAQVWNAATVPGGFTSSLNSVAYSSSNGLWVAIGSSGAVITSADGITWNAQTPMTIPGSYALNSVTATASGTFVAVGNHGTVMTSTNGTSWTAQTQSFSTDLTAVSTDSTQFVAVGAGGQAYTSADGISWTAASGTGTTADLFAVIGSASKYMAAGLTGVTISSIH